MSGDFVSLYSRGITDDQMPEQVTTEKRKDSPLRGEAAEGHRRTPCIQLTLSGYCGATKPPLRSRVGNY